MTPKRLRVVFHSESPEVGGAEVALGTLLGALGGHIEAALLATDEQVLSYLAACRPGMAAALLPTVGGKGDLRGWLGQARQIARLGPDIFHSNSGGGAYGLHALTLASVLPGVRTVLTEHAAAPTDTPLQRRMRAFAVRRLGAHVAPGQWAAGRLQTLHGLPPGSVLAIPNGVPAPHPTPTPEPRVGSGFVLGTAGRLHHEKGHDVAIRAMSELRGTELVIIGDGPERDALDSLVNELGLADRVHLLGHREQARNHLLSFDVFVLPSREETFGLAAIEAMQAGVPVIATRAGGLPETLGDAALMVEPDDPGSLAEAISELSRDPVLRQSLVDRGRRRATRYTPEAMAAAYEQLYAEVMGRSRTRPRPARRDRVE